MTDNPIAMAVQLQAMQALALERNIDLSNPVNANMMAQLILLMHSGMVAQQKANESNPGIRIESVPKQQVNSPQVANENSPRGNSSSDVSGQSGSYKGRQVVFAAPTKRRGEIFPLWQWGRGRGRGGGGVGYLRKMVEFFINFF
ncbi:ATP-dependent helicase BRM [Abeliophyllum distichum]|uniref:ATP-dependent helicase BRM n=1 Tax=Abeliophyllum distichum TaxID=126358 RepID=A0ABD1V919_9LAMI